MALNTVQALAQAQANRRQALEDVAWSVLTALSDPTFATVTGVLLDKIGARVGELRGGRVDSDYQAAIRLRIRVNRSRGKAEDIIAIAKLAAIHSTPLYTEPDDDGPLFEVDITNLPGGKQVGTLLGQAKPLGVPGLLVYSPDGQTYAAWGDSVSPGTLTPATTWGDSVGATGPLWGSAIRLSS